LAQPPDDFLSIHHRCIVNNVLAPAFGMLLAAELAYGQSTAELARLSYDADPHHSTVGFTIRLFGVAKVRGRFRDYAATILYDPDHIERSSVTAVIKTASIDTDLDFRDKHLRSPDFFDAATYPTIVFQSDRIERAADGYRAIGRFTMRGVTRVITMPVSLVLPPDSRGPTGLVNVAFEATTRLSRKDFGIAGTNEFNPQFNPAVSLLSDSVDVNIELIAKRAGYLTWDFRGQTPPSIADTVGRTIASHGIDDGVRLYRSLRAEKANAFNFGAGELDALGHQMTQRGQAKEALEVFKLNDESYAAVDGVTTSLAEAYAWIGDSSRAVAAYRRALQVDSMDTSAIEMLRHLAPRTETRAPP